MNDLKFILSFDSISTSYVLVHAPEGWDETLITWERSVGKYWGMFVSFSIPLKFVLDGAQYLREEFYTRGVASQCSVLIQKLNRQTMQYATAYEGTLDFRTVKDSQDYFEVTINEGGLSKLIKDNEGTEYQIENGRFDDTVSLRAVAVDPANTDHWVAVGDNGKFMYSADGGSGWNDVVAVTTDSLNGVVINEDTCIFVGDNGRIYKTTYAFSSIVQKTSGTTKNLNAICFDGANYVVVGDDGTILKSSNYGESWTLVTSGTTEDLNGVCNGSSYFFACGDNGVLLRTNDLITWTAITSGTTEKLNGVVFNFTDTARGAAVGENGALVWGTFTGNWALATPTTDVSLKSITIASDGGFAWACGEGGALVKIDFVPDPASIVATLDSDTRFGLYGIAYDGVNNIIAVGNDNVITFSNDVGVTFAVVSTGNVGQYATFGVTDYTKRICFYTTLKELGNQLLLNLAGASYVVKSDYLDSIEDAIAVTNGHSIRMSGTFGPNRPNDGFGYFKTTLEDWFKSINKFNKIGMGVEIDTVTGLQVLRLEPIDYFLKDVQTADLGDVKDANFTIRQELLFNIIKCGSPEKDYGQGYEVEQVNEPNTYSHFATLYKGKGEYDIIGKWRDDWTGMKLIIDEDLYGDSNDADDNEIYLIAIEDQSGMMTVFETKLRKRYNPTVEILGCNGDLSPKRSLLRHMRYINSCLWGLVPNNIYFVTGGNDQMNNVTYASDPDNAGAEAWVNEEEDVTMDVPELFLPIVANVSIPVPADIIELVNANPLGYFTFSWSGNTFKGFIIKASAKFAFRGEMKYDLLLTADTNTNLLK